MEWQAYGMNPVFSRTVIASPSFTVAALRGSWLYAVIHMTGLDQ
jgi:hypothetical protein